MYYTNVLPFSFIESCHADRLDPQTWDLAYFPINDDNTYDRFGKYYNVSRVLDSSNRFNATAYNEYSPLYMPATYAMTYLLAFALSTCVLVHTILYHGRSVLNGFKRIRVEPDDIHAKLMRNYPEVPDWWYVLFFVGFFLMMVVIVEVSRSSCSLGFLFFFRLRCGTLRCLYGLCCWLRSCQWYMCSLLALSMQ